MGIPFARGTIGCHAIHLSFASCLGAACAALLFMPPAPSWADTSDANDDRLQLVVVTATRVPTPEIQVASSVTVVTR